LLIGEIYKLKAAEKFICQLIEQKGVSNELKYFTVYEYTNNYISYIAVKNQTKANMAVEVDCSKSQNVQANNRNLVNNLSLGPEKNKLAMILMCKDKKNDWISRCSLIMNEEKSLDGSRIN